ncbi:MAG: bifunctional 3-phosphoshikimate 1-carboxyvinyltransferase/cytidylate kinase, partial [Saezia sp.]
MHSIPYLDIPALKQISGSIRVPGSKSISNRALLLAALCKDETTLYGVLDSDDTQVMLTALGKLGCHISFIDQENIAEGIKIKGFDAQSKNSSQIELFLGNAGTVMRPLTATLALSGGNYILSGVPRMHERPIGDLTKALRSFGCIIECTQNEGYPPLHISPPQLNKALLSQPIQVKGDTSSQFLTALLMALPLVAENDIVIDVVGELISKPYIAITLKLLKDFGVDVQNHHDQRFTIPAGSSYTSPG